MTDSTLSCCKHRGLSFAGDERRCTRHQTLVERTLVADLELQAKPILGDLGWPYGPNIYVPMRQRLISWAARLKLSLADTRCASLHWLRVGRCAVQRCARDGAWMDHVTRWERDASPAVLLSQPYGLADERLVRVGQLAADPALAVRVVPGWYYSGTVGIEVWRSDVFEAVFRTQPD